MARAITRSIFEGGESLRTRLRKAILIKASLLNWTQKGAFLKGFQVMVGQKEAFLGLRNGYIVWEDGRVICLGREGFPSWKGYPGILQR